MPEPESASAPLSPTDFHVLLVLAGGDLYGYAILKSVEEESGGVVSPEIGSLYRVLGRLMSSGMVAEVASSEDEETSHRGRPRRYYGLTDAGREALEADARRLEAALEIARTRTLLPEAVRP